MTQPVSYAQRAVCAAKISANERGVILNSDDVLRLSNHFRMEERAFLSAYCTTQDIELRGQKAAIFLSSLAKAAIAHSCGAIICATFTKSSLTSALSHRINFFFEAAAFSYECMENVKVPAGWNSDQHDEIFIRNIR